MQNEGYQNITGSRSATREAFNKDLINDGQTWMDMIESRHRTVHTYNETILEEEYQKIVTAYVPLFTAFQTKMKTLR